MKIAILVVDANEVAFENVGRLGLPSPVVHPAVQALFDALARRNDHDYFVLYGRNEAREAKTRRDGSLTYIGVPSPKLHLPGLSKGYWGRFRALRSFLRDLQPDIVHAQGTERESGMVVVHCGRPGVITLHGNFRELKKVYRSKPGSYIWLNAHLETHVLKRVHGIFCISRYVREITRSFGKPQFLIPNPVRPEFLSAPRPARDETLRHVCCMGTLDERKRPQFILEACIPLWKRGLEFTLHIYGRAEGSYYETMRRLADEWMQQERVVFEGFTPDPLDALLHSDVMVSASVEESFGMNVLEAMAAGTPVVAPRVGGILDIVEEEKSGLLFDANRIGECTEQICRLLEDNSLWEKISRAGRERSARLFSPQVVAAETVKAYEAVLQSIAVGRR